MTVENQTDKALSIVDKSIRVMGSSADNLKKIIAELASIAENSSNVILDLEFKQNQLENIDQQLIIKAREQSAELRLRVKEDEYTVLQELLSSRGQVSISVEELKKLREDLTNAINSTNESVNVAVKAEASRLTAIHNQEIERLKSTQLVETANLTAKLQNLEERNAFFQEQLAKMQLEATESRQLYAEVEKARANSSAVTVNNGPVK